MLKRICAIMLASVSYANAQDSTGVASKLNISGWADVYYRYSFADSINNYTSFTNSQNSFELGMVSLKAEHSFGKVSLVGDLGFGKRAEDFSYNDANTRLAIKQLYVSYAPTENFKLTAGSWATHIGYELVDAPGNRNYSMSYMFSYGPFFHTGLKAELTAGASGFMVGIVNPTDFKTANFSRKYVVGQYTLALADDKLKFFLNALAGKSAADARNNQFDLVVTGTVSSKFGIGYNGTIASSQSKTNGSWGATNSWWGSALYFNYDPLTSFGLTLRAEYFDDKHAVLLPLSAPLNGTTPGGNIFETTLSGNIRINSLTIIPEIRYEVANKEIYYKNSGQGSKNTASALLAAVYKF